MGPVAVVSPLAELGGGFKFEVELALTEFPSWQSDPVSRQLLIGADERCGFEVLEYSGGTEPCNSLSFYFGIGEI